MLILLSFSDYGLPYYWGNRGMVTKMNYLEQNKTNYNTYFIGSSRIFHQVIPALFDSLNVGKTRSFNLGVQGVEPPESCYLLEHFLEKPKPKIKYIIFELDKIKDLQNSHRTNLRSKYYLNFSYFNLGFRGALEQKEYGATQNYCISYFSRLIRAEMIFPRFSPNTQPLQTEKILGKYQDGYANLDDIEAQRLNIPKIEKHHNLICEEYKNGLDFYEVSPTYLTKIHQIIKKAKAKNIQLIFLKPPLNEGILPLYNTIETPYKIDISSPYHYPKLYELEHLHDWRHLNAEGAEIFTEILAKEFQKVMN